MTKRFSLISALLGLLFLGSVAFVSCKKEESDSEKGKSDGKAFCNCLKNAGDDDVALAKCENMVNDSKFSDEDAPANEYEIGFTAGFLENGCLDY